MHASHPSSALTCDCNQEMSALRSFLIREVCSSWVCNFIWEFGHSAAKEKYVNAITKPWLPLGQSSDGRESGIWCSSQLESSKGQPPANFQPQISTNTWRPTATEIKLHYTYREDPSWLLQYFGSSLVTMVVGRLIFSSAILLVIRSLPAGKESSSQLARKQILYFIDLSQRTGLETSFCILPSQNGTSGFFFEFRHFGSLRLSLAHGGNQWTRLHFFVGHKTNGKNLWYIDKKFLVRKILYTLNGAASFNPEVLLLN